MKNILRLPKEAVIALGAFIAVALAGLVVAASLVIQDGKSQVANNLSAPVVEEAAAVVEKSPVDEPPSLKVGAKMNLQYIGLPADEVSVLREQCLAENPAAACLPLPFKPERIWEEQLEASRAVALFVEAEDFPFLTPFAGVINVYEREDGLFYGFLRHEPTGGYWIELSFQLEDDTSSSKTVLYPPPGAEMKEDITDGLGNKIAISVDGVVSLGDLLFSSFGTVRLFLSETGWSFESRPGDLTIGSLLRDAEGRIIYILPVGSEPIADGLEIESPPEAAPDDGEYVGLSADEIIALREQCLAENPNSLCLPLPFKPDGIREKSEYVEMLDETIASLVLEAKDYTLLAPISGDLRVDQMNSPTSSFLGMQLFNPEDYYILRFILGDGADVTLLCPDGEVLEEWVVDDDQGSITKVLVALGYPLFASSGEIELGVMVGSPDVPMDGGAMSLTMGDLLRDDSGRIVYVLPTSPEPIQPSKREILDYPVEGPFVGLAAGEAEALREQCLAENPNSLCLPLPAKPAKITRILRRGEGWTFSVIEVELLPDTILVASLAVGFEDMPGDDRGFCLQAMQAEDGSVAPIGVLLRFHLPGGDDLSPDSLISLWVRGQGKRFLCSPSVGSVLVLQSEKCSAGTEVGDLTVESETVSVAIGDPLLRSPNGDTTLSIDFFTGTNVGADGVDRSWITEDDLLHDSKGRIVYILP